ncbi:hypothetical protein EK904_012078, partial [Melospiza melodia maxima]
MVTNFAEECKLQRLKTEEKQNHSTGCQWQSLGPVLRFLDTSSSDSSESRPNSGVRLSPLTH